MAIFGLFGVKKLPKKFLFIFFSTESCDNMYETPSCEIFSRKLTIWRLGAVVRKHSLNRTGPFFVFKATNTHTVSTTGGDKIMFMNYVGMEIWVAQHCPRYFWTG